MLLLLLSRFSRVRLCATPQTAPKRLPRPWDSPGKNSGVGCHFLLQCMKVKSESEVVQSCPTLGDSMDCSIRGSSIHGIFQARVLEWGAIAFWVTIITAVFPGGSAGKGKESTCKGLVFNPWVSKIPWRRKWQPTLVFLPGKSYEQRSLAGYRPWDCKESDTT